VSFPNVRWLFKITNGLKFNNNHLKFNGNFKSHITFEMTPVLLIELLILLLFYLNIISFSKYLSFKFMYMSYQQSFLFF
jgi:hypothetical protein